MTPGGITMSAHTAKTAGTGQELLARASHRMRVQPDDARASAVFERVTVGSGSFFVTRLSANSDWIMRVAGDHVHRPHQIWRSGLMDQAPGCVDHTVVAMDLTGAPGDDAVLTIVMRDVGDFLVPPGDAVVPPAQHARFIAHMATLSSTFWEWQDQLGLTPMAQRLRFFAPDNIAAELGADEAFQGFALGRRPAGDIDEGFDAGVAGAGVGDA